MVILRVALLLLLVGSTTLGSTTPVLADDVGLAKAAYKKGYQELQRERYKEALAHYQTSYKHSPRPRTLYNIALCHEGLGEISVALAKYQLFLNQAQERDADFLALAREKIGVLRKQVGAQLEIVSEPSGATVIIDGKARGHTPLRLHMRSGRHKIRIRRRGARTSSRNITISAGENRTESFELDSVGHLRIRATPSDALIRRKGVDDVETGVFEADLSPGSYEFEVSLMGYRTRSLHVEVEANEAIDRSIRLRPQTDKAEIQIHTDIRDANVSIDGLIVGLTRVRGAQSPSLERELIPGDHVVIVESRDDKSWSKRLHLSPGETLKIDLTFKQSGGREAVSWTLSTLGTVSMIAGVTLGVLAISDMRHDDEGRNQQGDERATKAGYLLGLGAVGLLGGWYVDGSDPKAELSRSH